MVVAIMARAVAVSVVGESNGAVQDPAARMTNRNPVNDENTTLLWMMFSTEVTHK
jgi:hypothetical protein